MTRAATMTLRMETDPPSLRYGEASEPPLPRGRLPRYRSPSDARSKAGDAILGGEAQERDPTWRWVELLKGQRYEDIKHG